MDKRTDKAQYALFDELVRGMKEEMRRKEVIRESMNAFLTNMSFTFTFLLLKSFAETRGETLETADFIETTATLWKTSILNEVNQHNQNGSEGFDSENVRYWKTDIEEFYETFKKSLELSLDSKAAAQFTKHFSKILEK
jgi:hypothetical protein